MDGRSQVQDKESIMVLLADQLPEYVHDLDRMLAVAWGLLGWAASSGQAGSLCP